MGGEQSRTIITVVCGKVGVAEFRTNMLFVSAVRYVFPLPTAFVFLGRRICFRNQAQQIVGG